MRSLCLRNWIQRSQRCWMLQEDRIQVIVLSIIDYSIYQTCCLDADGVSSSVKTLRYMYKPSPNTPMKMRYNLLSKRLELPVCRKIDLARTLPCKTTGGGRLGLLSHSPDPIKASPLALAGLAANGCAEIGVFVR